MKSVLRKVFRALKIRFLNRNAIKDENFIGFDKYLQAGAYHWEAINSNKFYRGKALEVLNLIPPKSRCLDVGCGDGAISGLMATKAAEVVGVDADVEAIRLAKKQAVGHNLKNCQFFHAPMSKITQALFQTSKKFDVLYSLDVIEHLPHPEQLLEAGIQVVKDDGLLIIGTPLFISPELVSPYHVKEFSIDEIRGILNKHMHVKEERILPEERLDGKVYERSFYLAIGTPRFA